MEFWVNGQHVIEANPDPTMTLLTYLRNTLHLTGAKLACGEGGCGACTIMVSDVDQEKFKPRHRAVNGCLAPLMSMDGLAVTTVEGIGSIETRLHPVQRAIADNFGSQCGFCTPGIVMTLYTMLRNNPNPTPPEIMAALDGNLCRCTGYRAIVKGMNNLTQEGCCQGSGSVCPCKDAGLAKEPTDGNATGKILPLAEGQEPIVPPKVILNAKAGTPQAMKVVENDFGAWITPYTLEQFKQARSEFPDARLMAGNTEIGVQVLGRAHAVSQFIFLGRMKDLDALNVQDATLRIGGNVTLRRLELELEGLKSDVNSNQATVLQAVQDALQLFAGGQIRSVATMAGNLANASPISDLNPIWLALDATVSVLRATGVVEDVPLSTFFKSYRRTALQPGDLIVDIRVPMPADGYCVWFKQSRRIDDDISIVNACIVTQVDAGNTVTAYKVALGGMAPTTVVVNNVQDSCLGLPVDDPAFVQRVNDAIKAQFVLDDSTPGGMPAYRLALAMAFVTKAFWRTVAHFINPEAIPEILRNVMLAPVRDHNEEYRAVQTSDELDICPESAVDSANKSLRHRSGPQQATGEALYLDDYPARHDELHAALVGSSKAHAKLVEVDATAALEMEGVKAFYTHKDIPGSNYWGVEEQDELLLAVDEVGFIGQHIGIIIATSRELAEHAARMVNVTYEVLSPILTIDAAIAADSYHMEQCVAKDGDASSKMESCEHVVEDCVEIGGQEQFYFETQGTIAIPNREGEIEVITSNQHLSLARATIASALAIEQNRVHAHIKRIGGGFGGKESRASAIAALAALAAHKSHRPVRLVLSRQEDMAWSGGRNPFKAKWKVGFNSKGRVEALDLEMWLNAGWTADLSNAVMHKAILHVDSVYKIPNIRVTGSACKTHLAPNTAFRGFGGPQAMLVMEAIMSSVAAHLPSIKPYDLRRSNMYHDGDVTYYGQTMEDCLAEPVWDRLMQEAQLPARETSIAEFNAANRHRKRGFAATPCKFGVCYEPTFLNQAPALVQVLLDGSVQLFHGGIEMGQGLHTKMIQVCATALQVPVSSVHVSKTTTDTTVNDVSTAASLSSDRYGLAIMDACSQINERLKPYRDSHDGDVTMKTLANAAWMDRVSLTASGFAIIEGVHFDFETMRGSPYSYWVYGAAVSEVEVDTLTGNFAVLRTDLVMDVGKPLNPRIDIGQIEGAFVQGMGLTTMEQKTFLADGRDITVGPGAYKIPAFSDIPRDFRVHLLRDAPNKKAVHSSKAVGEPPLFLGASVFFALQQAVAAARQDENQDVTKGFYMHSPATCERIVLACQPDEHAPKDQDVKPWKLLTV
eukprot:m.192536 g.192536  ORF g.192536 m.192536 type:complete len:1321 (+) comp16963_c0_seq4:154-4116(+)